MRRATLHFDLELERLALADQPWTLRCRPTRSIWSRWRSRGRDPVASWSRGEPVEVVEEVGVELVEKAATMPPSRIPRNPGGGHGQVRSPRATRGRRARREWKIFELARITGATVLST